MGDIHWAALRELAGRLGIARMTLLITVLSTFVSVAITLVIVLLITRTEVMRAVVISSIVPLVIAPVVSWLLLSLLAQLDRAERAQQQLVSELRQALDEVQVLSRLLPICAGCKNVRDDDGYWHSVETFVSAHSGLDFSHSLCPGCIEKLYPEHADAVLGEGPRS